MKWIKKFENNIESNFNYKDYFQDLNDSWDIKIRSVTMEEISLFKIVINFDKSLIEFFPYAKYSESIDIPYIKFHNSDFIKYSEFLSDTYKCLTHFKDSNDEITFESIIQSFDEMEIRFIIKKNI